MFGNKPLKVLILACGIAAIWVALNYPVINETVSFVILFICLSVVVFSWAKLKFEKDNTPDYADFEKQMDQLYAEEGDFRYTKNGFYLTQNNDETFIAWEAIQEINVFDQALGRDYQTGLKIRTAEKIWELYYNSRPGIDRFILQLTEQLNLNPAWMLGHERKPQDFVSTGLYKHKIYEKSANGSARL